MAVITDPTGAPVALWQARNHIGSQRIREPNTPTWAELATDDPERASAFFRGLLGIRVETMPMGEKQPPYRMLMAGEERGTGVFQKPADMGQAPNVWMVYFEVADANATAAKARSLGGTVLNEPWDIPGFARIAVLQDPQGAVFGTHQSTTT